MRVCPGSSILTGTLTDSDPSRELVEQHPLTLSFSDFGGQEKTAPLPVPLPLDGVPSGSDAEPLTIGYYVPDQVLVLFYERVGYFTGIVRLGALDAGADIEAFESDFSATLDLAG